MIENTANTNTGVVVGKPEIKKGITPRKAVVAICGLVITICLVIAGLNMSQTDEVVNTDSVEATGVGSAVLTSDQEATKVVATGNQKLSDSEMLQGEIISVLNKNDCKISECKGVSAEIVRKKPASAADAVGGIEESIFLNVSYSKKSGEVWKDRRVKLMIQKTTEKKLISTVVSYY